jgi:arylsulfatase A
MLSRRAFTRLIGQSAAASLAGPLATAQTRRPNIIVILADDLGYGDLSVYGHPTIRTPNLDRMAGEGVRFTQFYSGAASCSPARAALLTGRLPVRSGVNQVLVPWSKGGLPAEEVTIAEALKPAGYSTACVGKWHLGHLPQYLPGRHGFDRYFGIPYSNDMSRKTAGNPSYIRELERHPETPGTPLLRNDQLIESEPDQTRLTEQYTKESIDFIRSANTAKQPFFLYLAHTFPHVPLFASERFRGKSARGLYGDVVEELDWSVGEIRRTLSELKIDRQTLVLFTSDNGPWLVKRHEGGSAGLLREGKATTWEGGMREPFIAAWPGRIRSGTVSMSFGCSMDIFPTCAKLAGVPVPSDRQYDGVDLGPVLFDGQEGRDALMFYYISTELRAVRKGRWKLHFATNNAATEEPVVRHERPLLFDLLGDPSEKYDVSDSHPNIVKDLIGTADEHRRTLKAGPPQT